MAYTQSDIDAMKRAAAKGVLRVRMNGEEVQYQSLDQLRKQIRTMEAEVQGGSTGGMTVSYATTGRGL